MLTAAVRDLHHCYPGRFITDVRTLFPDLWENNPHITPLKEADAETIECSYPLINHSNEAPYHCLHGFVHFLNERLGLAVRPTAFKGDIHISAQERAWYSQVHELAGRPMPFWIVAAGGKYDLTIKWWETSRYQEVVDYFRGRIQFVQVGNWGNHHPKLEGVVDLRGKTTMRELVRLVYHAQGVLCPVTSLMHLAAAVPVRFGKRHSRPCVVVAGGREPAHWEAYPEHQFVHTNGALACCRIGGCWRDRTLPLRDGDRRDHLSSRCLDVVGGLPRCMDMISAAEIIRRIELYFAGGRLRYLSPAHRRPAERAVRLTSRNRFDAQPLTIHNAGHACEAFQRAIPPYPARFAGRGIVICGGGARYFTNAWVCVNMLRYLGCELPIQLWHLGARELDGRMAALMAPLGVSCVDAHALRKRHPARRLAGWELKPYAILHSPFREVLLLDADNVPVRDPAELFETPEYERAGAVFWPDYDAGPNAKLAAIWRSCGLRQPREPEFESGQVLVNKSRCWPALSLTLWFNEQSDFYYRYLHGDKETFHLAFRKTATPYEMVSTPIHPLTATMCQHDFRGRRVFQHRNMDKWDLNLRNLKIRGFWLEARCMDFVKALRRRWNGEIAGSVPRRSAP
jgi:ADP-heptose:LPS heptosyltransferase